MVLTYTLLWTGKKLLDKQKQRRQQMSIFNDKTLKSVADIAAKIMGESSHGTKPEDEKEKKLAALAHPKDKITHKDVLVGRGVLKKEARENVDEAISNKSMSSQAKTTIKHVDNPSVQDRMDAHDIKPGISGYRDRIDYLKRMKQMGKLKNEEAEQVDESVWDYKNSATAKKTGETTRTGHDIRKTTTGTVYTKRAAEEKPENEEPKSRKKQKLGATSNLMSDEEFKKKHGMSRKNYERMQSGVKIGESFCDMLEAYTEHGLKAFASLKEEPDNEQFTKELKDQIASMSGKKKQPSVAAPATQGVKQMPEEVEQIDEISKKTLGNYVKAAANDVAAKAAATRQFSNDAQAAKKNDDFTAQKRNSDAADRVFAKSWKRRQNMAKAVDRLTKEETELDERTLSEPEMKKREEYVKGMKKKLSGFKDRYGDRAKEVIYATATKMAKDE
jgi:hypothetical protein